LLKNDQSQKLVVTWNRKGGERKQKYIVSKENTINKFNIFKQCFYDKIIELLFTVICQSEVNNYIAQAFKANCLGTKRKA